LIRLRADDIAFGDDRRFDSLGHRIFVNIRKSKTGIWQGVEIMDHTVKYLVRRLIDMSHGSSSLLFPFADWSFRNQIDRACRAMHLPHYVPHSVRHGGATHDFINGMKVEDVMARGRWAVTKSARRYIQQSRQVMMMMDIPAWCADAGRCIRADLYGWIMRMFELAVEDGTYS